MSNTGKRDRPQARSLGNLFFFLNRHEHRSDVKMNRGDREWEGEWEGEREGGREGGRETLGQRSELGDQLADEQEKEV